MSPVRWVGDRCGNEEVSSILTNKGVWTALALSKGKIVAAQFNLIHNGCGGDDGSAMSHYDPGGEVARALGHPWTCPVLVPPQVLV